ncbi:MAG TPA: hypothetical protein VF529_03390 [Solirubrobacteraceae bacterium]|jgi:hypothetical protein
MSSRLTALALAVAALATVGAYVAIASRDDEPDGTGEDRDPTGCDVAAPKPGSAISGTFGSELTVLVPPHEDDGVPPGMTQGRRQPDGSIYAKILWRRDPKRASGRFRVTGRRLDGPGSRLRASVNQDHRKFVPSSLIFSDPGCWAVRARSGRARVRYVVRVVVQGRGG